MIQISKRNSNHLASIAMSSHIKCCSNVVVGETQVRSSTRQRRWITLRATKRTFEAARATGRSQFSTSPNESSCFSSIFRLCIFKLQICILYCLRPGVLNLWVITPQGGTEALPGGNERPLEVKSIMILYSRGYTQKTIFK